MRSVALIQLCLMDATRTMDLETNRRAFDLSINGDDYISCGQSLEVAVWTDVAERSRERTQSDRSGNQEENNSC